MISLRFARSASTVATRLLLFGMVALLVGCTSQTAKKDEAAQAEEEGEAIAVEMAAVRRANLDVSLDALGIVVGLPGSRVQVTNAIEGQVIEVLVAEGQEVKAGQPIARLDERLARVDLNDKRAARDELAATLAVLKAPPREPERAQAELDLQRTRVAREVAQSALVRLEPLQKRGEISEQQFFEAKERVRDAELAEQAAVQRQKALLQGPTPEAVHEAQTKVARAEAAAKGAELRLEMLVLSAPKPGTINRVSVNPGQWLAVGTVVAELIDTRQMLVQVGVPPTEAKRVLPKQRAYIALRGESPQKPAIHAASEGEESDGDAKVKEPAERPAYRDAFTGPDVLTGEVMFVGNETQAANGLVPVNIRVDDAKSSLRLGAVASARIVIGTEKNVLAVPESAVVPSEEGPVVMAVRNGKTETISVEVGARHGGLTQVTSAKLHEGDQVVTQGAYSLPEDTAVTSEHEAAKSAEK